MTGRVMTIIRDMAPECFRYSIDEAFAVLDGFTVDELHEWGTALHDRVMQSVGMPVSIGIAPTKTMAKMASHYAKKYAGYGHCCVIDTEERRIKAEQLYPIGEVWGIGRRYQARLESMGHKDGVRLCLSCPIVGERHVPYRNGWSARGRSLTVRTAFRTTFLPRRRSGVLAGVSADMTLRLSTLCTLNIANFAARCAEKARRQSALCGDSRVPCGYQPFPY